MKIDLKQIRLTIFKIKGISLKKKVGLILLILIMGFLIIKARGKEESVSYLTEKVSI